MNINEIAKQFDLEGEVTSIERYGFGHINETYLLLTSSNQYILQKINNHIFKDVEGLMNNIVSVLSFQKKEIRRNGGNEEREALTIILTKEGKPYFVDEETSSYYRVYLFIKDSLAIQNATSKEEFAESGRSFGKFQMMLASFDASKLIEVIPSFHNTKTRFEHFVKTLKADPCSRAKNCQTEIEFVLKRERDCEKIVNLIASGDIPLKVTHNDTKLNNVLFDKFTRKGLCVIDLDTIMPGSSLYDFGDSIRFGCNTGAEDEKDLSKVDFSLDYFKAYAEAYLKEVAPSLNKAELDNLAYSAKLMTLECGIRFLDDYLDGNKYFATKYEEHNLIRARTQFKLVELMEKRMDELESIIQDIHSKIGLSK